MFGSAAGCGVVLHDKAVSAQHAKVVGRAGDFIIRDLESTNGVEVNGERLSKPHLLRSGDRVRLGSTELLFKCVAPARRGD